MDNFGLLPNSKPYIKLLLPYFLPYGLYTGMGILADFGIQEWVIQLLKLISVLSCLIYFHKEYRFGKFYLKHAFLALLVTPFLLCAWIYPLKFCLDLGIGQKPEIFLAGIANSEVYFFLRLVNSVILVALFEELFCRVYLMEFLHQGGANAKKQSFLDRILAPLDEVPQRLQDVPFSIFSLLGTTIFFTMGHGLASYISAIVYFSLTNLLYWRTQSFWTCIFTHAFTNLGIAILVKVNGDLGFLWF